MQHTRFNKKHIIIAALAWLLIFALAGVCLLHVFKSHEKEKWENHIRASINGTAERFNSEAQASLSVYDLMTGKYDTNVLLLNELFKNNNIPVTDIPDELLDEFGVDNYFILNNDGEIIDSKVLGADAETAASLEDVINSYVDKIIKVDDLTTVVFDSRVSQSYRAVIVPVENEGFMLSFYDYDNSNISAVLYDSYDIVMSDTLQNDDEFDVLCYFDPDNTEPEILFYKGYTIGKQPTPYDNVTVESLKNAGITFENGWNGTAEIDNKRYLCAVRLSETGRCIVHLCSEDIVYSDAYSLLLYVLVCAAGITFLICLYTILTLRADERKKIKHKITRFTFLFIDKTNLIKTLPVAAFGIVFIFAFGFYAQILTDSANQTLRNVQTVKQIKSSYDGITRLQENHRKAVFDIFIDEAKAVERIVGSKEGDIDSAWLSDLSDDLGIEGILIFDNGGKLKTTDLKYSGLYLRDIASDGAMLPLLTGVDPIVCESAIEKSDTETFWLAGAPLRDKNNNVCGALVVMESCNILDNSKKTYDICMNMASMSVDDNSILFSVDKDLMQVYFSTNDNFADCSTEALDLNDKALSGDYTGMLRMLGRNYIVSSGALDNDVVFIASDISYSEQLRISFIITVIFGLITGLTFLAWCVVPAEYAHENMDNEASDDDLHVTTAKGIPVYLFSDIYNKSIEHSIQMDSYRNEFAGRSPVKNIKGIAACLFLVLMIIVYRMISAKNGVVDVFKAGQWENNINIFSLTFCVVSFCFIMTVSALLRFVLKIMADVMEQSAATICRMIRSVIRYAAVFVCLFLCLSLIGVDTKALLASLGIMGAVIGLGANKLIGDLVAGLFVIFEGNVNVGDIVQIDQTYGIVKEIGLRTIQIVTRANDIVIINNSSINNITNTSRFGSIARTEIEVPHDVDIDMLENVLNEEMQKLADSHVISHATWGPLFRGFKDVTERGVLLSFVAGCDERYKSRVRRMLNREIKRIFEEHNIPFTIFYFNSR